MKLRTEMIVSGPVYLRPIGPEEQLPRWRWIILILGETGVGKSNFLEALHGDRSLGIAGDQLEAVTKSVTAYELMNARCKPRFDLLNGMAPPIFLVDTPGFGDSQTSELQVVKEIQEWLSRGRKPNEMRVIDRIFYFQRITDKRLSGSQIKIANLVKVLLGSDKMADTYIITTMWDTMWTDLQLSQAEGRFQELINKHWKEPSAALKFDNTQKSALELIGFRTNRAPSQVASVPVPPITYNAVGTRSEHQIEFSRRLYDLIVGRIDQLCQRMRVLDDDLDQQLPSLNEELVSRLVKEKSDVCDLLVILEKERDELYPAAFMGLDDVQADSRSIRGKIGRGWKKLIGDDERGANVNDTTGKVTL